MDPPGTCQRGAFPATIAGMFARSCATPALRLWFWAALAVAAPGCNEKKQEPEDAFRRFAADVNARRADAAWAALTESSQQELERRHEAIAEASGSGSGAEAGSGSGAEKKQKATPGSMLFEQLGLVVLSAPESVVIVSPPGREVLLRVTVKDGKTADVRMVREGARWKVDLMGSLKKAVPLERGLQGPLETDTSTVP